MKGERYIREVFRDRALVQADKSAQEGSFLLAALELLKEIESPLREEVFAKLALRDLRRSDHPLARRAA
jgi:hypothetical protein